MLKNIKKISSIVTLETVRYKLLLGNATKQFLLQKIIEFES